MPSEADRPRGDRDAVTDGSAARQGNEPGQRLSRALDMPVRRLARMTNIAKSSSDTAPSSTRWLAAERTQFLVDHSGDTALAQMLDVPVRRVSRWRRGLEKPASDAVQRLLALDHVMASVLLLWPKPVALDWLRSPNAHLDGARPLDVLARFGPWEVINAVEAEMTGAFA